MLELKNIVKDYAVGDDKVRALKGINLAFRENEMVSILGQSGCGKTTLLNIIGGLDGYTDGDLIIDGRSTKYFKASDWDAYRNQKIGFVFQSYNLISHLTVLGNVELALTLSGIKKSERRERAIEALRRVGLESEIKKRPNQMSGGQMQRVAIARAIVNNPDIILADEPTGALDSDTGIAVMDILKEIARDRLVIMVTHNRELAERYSTRIISMLDGEIVNDTAPVGFISEVCTPNDVSPIRDEALSRVDVKPEHFAKQREKLESKRHKKQQAEITKANRAALKRTSMTFPTALGLSWRNLITKKGRTIATAIAGSIGIIGVALVLALSNGFNMYIDDMQTSMLANFPVAAAQMSLDMKTTVGNMSEMRPSIEQYPDGNKIIINPERTLTTYHYNRFTNEYLDHVSAMPDGLAVDVLKGYSKIKIILSANMQSGYGAVSTENNSMSSMFGTNSTNFQPLLNNSEYVLSQYDVLGGKYPTAANELAVVIGTDNSINASVLRNAGLKIPDDVDNATFDDIIGQKFKYVHNNEWFTYDDKSGFYKSFDTAASQDEWKELYDDPANLTLEVVGIMRIKESTALSLFNTGVVYTTALDAHMIEDGKNSNVGKAQRANSVTCISDALNISFGATSIPSYGMPFAVIASLFKQLPAGLIDSEITADDLYENALQAVGASDLPISINFYPMSFAKKTDIINYLYGYNAGKDLPDRVYVLDAASLITDSVSDMIDIISYVLIAFAAISLVVSSVMISIITFASVVERTKEIGVLRSVGARKTDIMRVFNAETIIIGLAAGVFGVLVTFVLAFPLSAVFKSISDGMVAVSLVVPAWWHALLLIAVSVLLTLIAGMLPARAASNKDPVVALRSE